MKSYCVLIFIQIFLGFSHANLCINQDPCVCKLDEHTLINLTDLQPSEGSFFQDGRINDVSYFFAGCKNKKFDPAEYKLITKESIEDVSLVKCISTVSQPNMTINQTCRSIGVSKDIRFDLASNQQYQIVYQNKSTNNSLPSITLACDTFNRTDLKVISFDTDALILYSPLACLHHLPHHELSSGSIFCLIFFLTVIFYFLVGGLIMYFARGARGVEIIPNYDFWASIPGLMRDGLIFLLNGCRPFTASTAETYDRI